MRTRSMVIVIAVVVAILAAGMGALLLLKETGLWNMMKPFTVTVKNESNGNIVIVEAGTVRGQSKHTLDHTLESGKTFKFTPDLDILGEDGVYMTHTNAEGATVQTSVCGYTEYLSGSAKVTINDDVEVEQDCH
ncbi:hypothetical protein [Paenibacillus sp. PL2-23]|uniref:hypothetical protein n=1 Tax=Paenibacillus sp. PL2-23 TaxID=2100729 RepID=UPI0030FBDD77